MMGVKMSVPPRQSNVDIRAAGQLAMKVVQPQYVALHQLVVVVRIS
jgi:hypothetical protein